MNQNIPVQLKIVAWLFIVGGILDTVSILVSLTHNDININLGVVNIFAGIGLLKLRSGWRTYSLVMIWLALIITPIILIMLMSTATPLDFKFFGQKIGYVSRIPALVFGLIIYAVVIWEYRVINRPDIKELFIKHRQNQGADPTESGG